MDKPMPKITGICRSDHSPTEKPITCTSGGIFATITLNGETEKAKIDTGAIHSFISEEYSKELWTADNYTSVWTTMRLANGTSVRIAEALVVTVCLGNRLCKIPLQILHNATDRLVLGLDFLCSINAVLVLADHAITLSPPKEVTTNSDNLMNEKTYEDDETMRPLNVTPTRPDNIDNHEHEQNEATIHYDMTPARPDNCGIRIKPKIFNISELPEPPTVTIMPPISNEIPTETYTTMDTTSVAKSRPTSSQQVRSVNAPILPNLERYSQTTQQFLSNSVRDSLQKMQPNRRATYTLKFEGRMFRIRVHSKYKSQRQYTINEILLKTLN